MVKLGGFFVGTGPNRPSHENQRKKWGRSGGSNPDFEIFGEGHPMLSKILQDRARNQSLCIKRARVKRPKPKPPKSQI